MPHASPAGSPPEQPRTLIPRPRWREDRPGRFELGADTVIVAPPALGSEARLLQRRLQDATGFPLPLRERGRSSGVIELRLTGPDGSPLTSAPARDPEDADESFELIVEAEGVQISGADPAGVYYGSVALLQLLPSAVYRHGPVPQRRWTVDAVHLHDGPAHSWRGLMLDTVRHFWTKADVLRLIDQMADHRLNRLHLHLTDDQGWRVRIDAYPLLTEVGGWRTESQVGALIPGPDGEPVPAGYDGRPHGGHYSKDDVREIVAYAAQRHIVVVPEIETPGHVRAAIAAYPWLGVTGEVRDVWTRWGVSHDVLDPSDETVAFFTDVLDEIVELFPSRYIGIGGDECPKEQWRESPEIQERIARLGLRDEDDLQSWFVSRLVEHIERRGRRGFGWDEILEGDRTPRSAAVMSWRGMHGAEVAARRGNPVISTPDDQVYFDYRQAEGPGEPIPTSVVVGVREVFHFDPVPAGLDEEARRLVLGGQANMWTEHVDTVSRLDYMLHPRMAALAEALWSADQDGPRAWGDFEDRLAAHVARLEAMGIDFRPPSGPHPWQQRPGVPGAPLDREEREELIGRLTANVSG